MNLWSECDVCIYEDTDNQCISQEPKQQMSSQGSFYDPTTHFIAFSTITSLTRSYQVPRIIYIVDTVDPQ